MIYKVGDRVRVVAININTTDAHLVRPAIGLTGTVTAEWERKTTPYIVLLDSGPLNSGGEPSWFFAASELAPLTPPDAWAADAVRKVTRVHVEPVAPKVTA